MPITPATADQLPTLNAAVQALELQMQTVTAPAALRHMLFWNALEPFASTVEALGQPVIADNVALATQEQAYGRLLKGLKLGRFVVVPWAVDAEGVALGAIQLGIANAGDNNLGQWQLLPVIVRVAVQVVAGVGAWLIANAWTHAKELEAKADQTRADTQAKVSTAIATLASADPKGASALADALTRANNAAAGVQPGAIDRVIDMLEGAGKRAGGFLDSIGDNLLVVAVLAWLLMRRKS